MDVDISGASVPFAEASILPTVSSDLSTGDIGEHNDSSQRAWAVGIPGEGDEGDGDEDEDESHVLHDDDNMDQFDTIVDYLSRAAV